MDTNHGTQPEPQPDPIRQALDDTCELCLDRNKTDVCLAQSCSVPPARARLDQNERALEAADGLSRRLTLCNELLKNHYSDQLPTEYSPSRTQDYLNSYAAARAQSAT